MIQEIPQISSTQDLSKVLRGCESKVLSAEHEGKFHDQTWQSTSRFVQHDYHDHSEDQPSPGFLPSRRGRDIPFPIKLHDMLDLVDGDGLAHIISWQPHGRCVVIHKPELIHHILPRYFKFSKWSTFQRQLNLYGFKRITAGFDTGGYYHEKFLKGRVFLAAEMPRSKLKGQGYRAKANPNQEPNFWAMPPVRNLPIMQGTIFFSEPEEIPRRDCTSSVVSFSKENSFSGLLPSNITIDLEPTPILEPALSCDHITIEDMSVQTKDYLMEWFRFSLQISPSQC
jgi:hypothetical protein